jgi:hypothetical protein
MIFWLLGIKFRKTQMLMKVWLQNNVEETAWKIAMRR